MRRATLIAWLKQETYEEGRGWVKGTLRKYTPLVRKRVIALKQVRIDKKKYFLGSPHIQMDYVKRYPKEDRPSLWFIDESVRRAGLQTHAPKKRTKGQDIVQRQRFPIKMIVGLGRIRAKPATSSARSTSWGPASRSPCSPPATTNGLNCSKYTVF